MHASHLMDSGLTGPIRALRNSHATSEWETAETVQVTGKRLNRAWHSLLVTALSVVRLTELSHDLPMSSSMDFSQILT